MSAMATILGVFLTIYAIINNRTLKEGLKATREILDRIELGQREDSKATRQILARIELGQNEARREMAEAIRYLGDLIHLEGEKTRQ